MDLLLDRASGRSPEFGSLGGAMFGCLKRNLQQLRFLLNLTFPQQLSQFELNLHSIRCADPLLPAAISLLCFSYPLQVTTIDSLTDTLLLSTFPKSLHKHPSPVPLLPNEKRPRSYGSFAWTLVNSKTLRSDFYPVKPHPGASSKPMVRLSALIRSLITIVGSTEAGRWLSLIPILTPRDVMVSFILYSFALRPHFPSNNAEVAAALILNPKDAKGLSNAIKALGLNATTRGACLTEAASLQGRMSGKVDWAAEIESRCHPTKCKEGLVNITADELRPHVRAILEMELPKGFTLPTLEDFWSSRWAWCVNGSHTNLSSRLLGIQPNSFPGFERTYRRMAAEYLTEEPITAWDGTTTVSPSEKLEHGKTRAIFACDTRSYLAWSWPLNAVAKAWKNKRVLLDPGRGGMSGIGHKIGAGSRTPGVNLMLDFDNFNSQHSTEIMKMITEETLDLCDCPPHLRKSLLASFDRTYVAHDGKMSRILETLMSGHKGTTFFNSVCNGAYFRLMCGGDLFNKITSLHTGDDIFARVPTLYEVDRILKKGEEVRCRMNPTKQSIGHHHSEFLRCAFSQRGGVGYVARSIATCASGSWDSSEPLGPREALTHVIGVCRSLINRSGQQAFPRLIGPALRLPRNMDVRGAIEMLAGGVASLDTTPVFNTSAPFSRYRLVLDDRESTPDLSHLPSNATRDYLSNHASQVEIFALGLAKVDPQPVMAASSYSKGSATTQVDPPPSKLRKLADYRPVNPGFATGAQFEVRQTGVLNQYPLIHLIADSLRTSDLVQLLSLLGVSPGTDPRQTAFGAESRPSLITGVLPFSDAASIARNTGYDHIYVPYPIAM